MLISLFERAYLLLYDQPMSDKRWRWRSWEDYMREWCSREDFHTALPVLVKGEDPEFVNYLRTLAANAAADSSPRPAGKPAATPRLPPLPAHGTLCLSPGNGRDEAEKTAVR